MNNNNGKAMFIDYTPKELAREVAQELLPEIQEQLKKAKETEAKKNRKLDFGQACDYMNISRTTMTKLIKAGKVRCGSLNPDYYRSKKYFFTKDLDAFLESNRSLSINDIKNAQ
jgi:hypothetical protein